MVDYFYLYYYFFCYFIITIYYTKVAAHAYRPPVRTYRYRSAIATQRKSFIKINERSHHISG